MFKDVKGYEGYYTINESGVVKNCKGHVLRYAESNAGYLRVALQDYPSTHRTNKSIHRMVAEAFIPNPDNLPIVMHKDNDRMNNHYSNLKWGTLSENTLQAYADGLAHSPCCHNYKYYEIYNDDHSDTVLCHGYPEIAETICYKEISIKNMVCSANNNHPIAQGPYKGYKIHRVELPKNSPIYFY